MSNVRCIYRIRHIGGDGCYVGQTVNMRSRKASHLAALRRGRCTSPYLQRAFDKHGETAFSFEILEIVAAEEGKEVLTAAEQKWIEALSPAYNSTQAANSRAGVRDSEETRRRKSEAARGNRNAAGRVASESERRVRSERMAGNKIASSVRSEEWRARQSEMMRGNSFARKVNMTQSEVPRAQ